MKIRSIPNLIKAVQKEFNKFICQRDEDKGCVSCQWGEVEQAGHFYSAGQFPALRFNEDNVHGQCIHDNYYKHGNLLEYKKTLLKRIGQQRFDLLESSATRHRFKKWNRTELQELLKIYKEKNKIV